MRCIKIIVCNICGKEFEKAKSMTSHRRWHNLPEYKEFQEKYRKRMSEVHSGKIVSKETGKKISTTKKAQNLIHDKNHNWKGDDVSYTNLHIWVRKYKPKPEACEECGKKKDYLVAANISGEYKRDLEDYRYLCYICHLKFDGNWDSFLESGKNTRFQKGHKNELRYGGVS